jgi:hypothetical protein
MIITNTSDKIQFKLGSSATTQLPFTVDYNNYTSTNVSLITNNGTSNDTTAVDLVPSPSSGQQNELRYCSIYNADTSSEVVTIQVFDGTNTRVVFRAVLAPRATLQYQLEKGWEVIDQAGNKVNSGIVKHTNSLSVGNKLFKPSSNATAIIITNTVGIWFVAPLGRVDKAYNTITIQYRVSTAAATITYAEMAIYSGFIKQSEGVGGLPGTRRGVTDISGVVNSLGIKSTAISVSGLTPGELFQVIISVQATTALQLRTFGITETNAALSNFSTPNAVTGGRPSTVSTGAWPTAGTNPIWFAWQGS